MIKKAMILAAGFGKRLNPITLKCPKPLLPIGEQTLLSNTLSFLEKFGITQVVINVHYLSDQIIKNVNKKNFNLNITIINEEKKILDTGGGILNALEHFKESFICINPDTVWNFNYMNELKKMENDFFANKKKCYLLVVDKIKSFDKDLKGDFNLQNGLIKKNKNTDLKYIFTGLQIINPEIFLDLSDDIFPINRIWDKLIERNQLFALESNINFLNVSTLDIYQKLNIK
jgi:N-acetyl-alpha-D-muramate 1-phosphate uridylyltransferase